MFSNIGNKIRILAKVICIIGMVFAALSGLALIIVGITMVVQRIPAGAILIFGGFIFAGFGALFAWIGSFVLYGYGQLIHSVQNLENKVCGLEENLSSAAPASASYEPVEEPVIQAGTCPNCGTQNSADSSFCIKCGQRLN